MKRIISLLLSAVLICALFSGCKETTDSPDTSSSGASSSATPIDVDFAKSEDEIFTERDLKTEYDQNSSVLIELKGSSASASSKGVKISGSTVTITENATHIITGSLDDGMIIVDADETAKLQIVLNGVNITSKSSAAIYIRKADKVFITLAEGSKNTLSNGGSFTAIDENNIDAALFSKQDLTLNGSGTLTVTSPVGHGIVCKDDIVITSGSYNITSAAHGLDANDSIRLKEADITVDAGKDGLHAENSEDASLGFVYIGGGELNLECEGDGISSGSYMQIENGLFDLLCGGGSENGESQSSDSWGGFMGGPHGFYDFSQSDSEDSSTSMKGIKSSGNMLISNGTFNINSADDSIHSNADITINGGSFEISSGDDGIHAETTLSVTSGEITVTTSYEGLEALDLEILGGDIHLVADDDGLNAAGGTDSSGMGGGRDGMFGGSGGWSSSSGSIKISGGKLYIRMSGDGIDSNGTLEITGGEITVSGATRGDTAILDFESSGTIDGGTFIGMGASGMAQNFSSSSKQGVIMVNTGSQSAGSAITLKDEDGKPILSAVSEQSFTCVILSASEIKEGGSYTLNAGSYSEKITMNSNIYGGSGGMGGMGGMGGVGGMGGRK